MPRANTARTACATTLTLGLAVTLLAAGAAPAHATDVPVKNPGFEATVASGEPADWGVWRAQGSGTSALSVAGAGPDGSRAVALVGDSVDDRIAVTQRVPYPLRVHDVRAHLVR